MRRPLAPRSQPNLILGMVDGMSWAEIRPFVVSLRRTSFEGDVLLFVADLDRSTVDSIRSAGIHVVKARRLQMQIGGRLLYPYHPRLEKLHPLYPGLVRSVSRVSSDSARTSAALAALLSVRDISRFFRYYRHLSKHGGAYANVMLTDVRDVFFQRDPFDVEFGDELQCFLEDTRETIATQPHNRKWVQAAFGSEILSELGDRPIVCAGVTIGPPRLVVSYLSVMVDFLLKLRHQSVGLDQAVHNYILHRGLVPKASLIPNGNGAVATLGIVPREDVHGLLDAPVLHQYDRHPALAETLRRSLTEA
jgi:hypothetical protein